MEKLEMEITQKIAEREKQAQAAQLSIEDAEEPLEEVSVGIKR
jgi:hypothetical protein